MEFTGYLILSITLALRLSSLSISQPPAKAELLVTPTTLAGGVIITVTEFAGTFEALPANIASALTDTLRFPAFITASDKVTNLINDTGQAATVPFGTKISFSEGSVI